MSDNYYKLNFTGEKINDLFVINIVSPETDMFNFETLPTFYLFGIKL